MTWQDLSQKARGAWAGMSLREQRAVGVAALLAALALLIGLGIWPALGVLRRAPAEQQRLSQQLAAMTQLQARATALNALPRVPPANSEPALRQSLQPLADTASVQISEQRAQVTLRGADAAAVTAWWAQARTQAQATPQEARLQRRQLGEQAVWDGQVVMGLAPR